MTHIRAVLIALAALGGWTAAGGAQTRVTFATDWKAQAEHGGFYQAVATGLYARQGLEVTIRMGGPGIDTQRLMAAQAVDLAMASNNFFALNLVRAGANATTIMAVFQKDPQILMAHPRDDVRSLADMKGKPIMLASGSVSTFWVWLKAKYGFEDSQIRQYTFNMAPFIVDKNGIQQGYLSSEPFLVQKESGMTPKVFLLADSGWPSYSCMVLASDRLIQEQADRVQAFVNASIEGWYGYLYGDPAPANALIKRANPEMTDETLAYGLAKMKEYGVVDSGDAITLGIGAMTEARWQDFFASMAKEGAYPADLPWRQAFTTRFVNKRHGIELRRSP